MRMKPNYSKIAALELEVYGEVLTFHVSMFKHNCPHCKTINWGGAQGMMHAFDCRFFFVQYDPKTRQITGGGPGCSL